MGIADATENALLLLIFNATTWANYANNASASPETNIVIAGHTADPGDAGAQNTSELAYSSYARVNVLRTSYPPDVAERATSLETELGRAIDREALLAHLLDSITDACRRLRRGEADGILRAWRAVSPSAVGARVEWNGGSASGVTAGIYERGALLVQSGYRVERIMAGELRWIHE